MRRMSLPVAARAALLGLALLPLAPASGRAQGQPELIKNRDQKLAKPFLKLAPWSTDYVKVREEARRTGKLIFAVFSRSFAPCPECDQLEDGMLADPGFVALGKQVVLFFHLTSLVREDDYQDLMQRKGGGGYPAVLFLDERGEVVGRPTKATLAECLHTLDDLTRWREAKRKVDGGDKSARKALLLAELALGKVSAKDARARLKDAGTLSKDERARVELALVNLDAKELLEQCQTQGGLKEAGRKLVEMKQARRIPTEGWLPVRFWTALVDYGVEVRDWRLCEDAIAECRKGAADPALLRIVSTLEDTLRKARN